MAQRNRFLVWSLVAIVLVGLFAAKIDPWARENSEAYLGIVRWTMGVILFFAVLFHGASGKLKSGPDRRNAADVVDRNSAISVLIASYLLVLAIVAVTLALLGVRLGDYLGSPLLDYFLILPFVLIGLWGKYKADRYMRPDSERH